MIRCEISAAFTLILLFLHIGAPVTASAEPVGFISPMTGSFERYGQRIRAAAESVRSPLVQFRYEDEGCQARMAVSSFRKLNSIDNIRYFIGPWCGSPQVAVASLLPKADGVAILGSSAPERVYALSQGRMLAVQPSIEAESRFNAEQAYSRGARKVVIVFLENDFSRAHEAAFRAHFKGQVVDTLAYSSADGSEIRALALKIRQLNPDTVYVPDALPLMHGLLKHLANVGATGLRLMSVYSAQLNDILTVVGPAGEGLIYSYPKITGDALDYYPKLAVEVLSYGLSKCPDVSGKCVLQEILKRYPFNDSGVLQGELGLKTISGGKFVWAPEGT